MVHIFMNRTQLNLLFQARTAKGSSGRSDFTLQFGACSENRLSFGFFRRNIRESIEFLSSYENRQLLVMSKENRKES